MANVIESAATWPRIAGIPVGRRLAAGAAAAGLIVVGTSAGAVLAPVPVLGVLLAGALALAVWNYPALAIGGLILLLPFNVAIFIALASKAHVHTGPLGDWKDAVVVLLFLRAIEARRRTEGLHVPRSGFSRFLIGYVLVYVLLTVGSPHLRPAIYAVSRDVEGPLLFLAILWLRPGRRAIVIWLGLAVAAALVLGAAAVYERVGPHAGFIEWYGAPPPGRYSSFLPGGGGYRSGSFLDSPLILAFYMSVSAPVALGYAAAFRRRGRLALLGGLASAAVAGGILAAETRSGYLGGGVGLALVLLLVARNRNVRTAMIGVFVIAVAALLVLNANSTAINRPGEDSSKQSAWLHDFDLITQHPLGFGLGTIDSLGQRFGSDTQTAPSSESTLLAKGVEGGVVALLMYPVTLLLLFLILLEHRRRALARGDAEGAALASGAAGGAVAVLAAGLFLGIQELVVEIAVWAPAAMAVSWSRASDAGRGAARGPLVARVSPPMAVPATLSDHEWPLPTAVLEPADLADELELLAEREPVPHVEAKPTPEPVPEPELEPEPLAHAHDEPAPVVAAAPLEPAWPPATVVLPASSAPDRVLASLRSLSELDYADYEVLLVGGAEETAQAAADACSGFRAGPAQVVSPADALSRVHGDVLAVLQAGARAQPGWLRAGVVALAQPRTGIAIGSRTGGKASGRFFRTDVLRYAGALAEALDPVDGAALAQSALERAGWAAVDAPDAVAEISPRPVVAPPPAAPPTPTRQRRREAELLALAVGIGVTRQRPLLGAALGGAYLWSRRRRYGYGSRPGD